MEMSTSWDSDAGEYVCQLSLLTGLLSLQHTLYVLGPLLSSLQFIVILMISICTVAVRPSVRALEAQVTVKEGEEARLECEVQGNQMSPGKNRFRMDYSQIYTVRFQQ